MIETSWPQLVPQKITNWPGWPADVHDVIWKWNHDGTLSFRYASRPRINGVPYFKCYDCARFIQIRGADRCMWNGQPLCEDCLIARARAFLMKGEQDDNPGGSARDA